VGNCTGGSWHGVISKLSKNPDVAYHLLSFMATPDVARELAYYGWEGVDPGRACQFMEPYGTNTKQGFLDAGWNENDIVEYNKAFYDNYYAKVQLPYMRFPGAMEYWTVLDQALSEAMIGKLTAQQALDQVAKDYAGIVERLGKDEQLKVYREAMGYAGATN
jgi:multiple sugar transport system substrate-binding protein